MRKNILIILVLVAVMLLCCHRPLEAQVTSNSVTRGPTLSRVGTGGSSLSGFRAYSTSASSLGSRQSSSNRSSMGYGGRGLGGSRSRVRNIGQLGKAKMPMSFASLLSSKPTMMSFSGAPVGRMLTSGMISGSISSSHSEPNIFPGKAGGLRKWVPLAQTGTTGGLDFQAIPNNLAVMSKQKKIGINHLPLKARLGLANKTGGFASLRRENIATQIRGNLIFN